MRTYSVILTLILLIFLGACSTQEQQTASKKINTDIKNNSELKTDPVATADQGQTAQPGHATAQNKPIVQSRPVTRHNAAAGKPDRPMRRKSKTAAAVPLAEPAPAMEMSGFVAQSASPYDKRARIMIQPNTMPYQQAPVERENYQHVAANPIHLAREQPVSTFSIDVDTGSYSNVRRILHGGRLPVQDAVRVEEFINYFSYDYPLPQDKQIPFNIVTEVGPTPWNSATRLLHIGIKGYDVDREQLPPANLVFLVDVSGSMNSPAKLPLLKGALKLLTNKLRAQDKVAIAVYAGSSGTVLPPTAGDQKAAILAALQNLSAGGSTNGASGIRLAYQMARQSFVKGGINRVILATDGDFNVGTVNLEALKNLIEQQRRSGITLTTLGFGQGNYNDALMEQLADIGNGNYAYIDTLLEAQKQLIDEMGSTLLTIAKDVKLQIEFNPAVVHEYRLVGYENRKLRREDFNNDKVDAGDIGAGHTVTAIYEIALVNGNGHSVDPLRYQTNEAKPSALKSSELAFLKIRYKQPDADNSQLLTQAINTQSMRETLAATTPRFQFSASVAAFGQLLTGGRYTRDFDFAQTIKLAQQSKGADPNGHRGEFVKLVKLAQSLQGDGKISLNK